MPPKVSSAGFGYFAAPPTPIDHIDLKPVIVQRSKTRDAAAKRSRDTPSNSESSDSDTSPRRRRIRTERTSDEGVQALLGQPASGFSFLQTEKPQLRPIRAQPPSPPHYVVGEPNVLTDVVESTLNTVSEPAPQNLPPADPIPTFLQEAASTPPRLSVVPGWQPSSTPRLDRRQGSGINPVDFCAQKPSWTTPDGRPIPRLSLRDVSTPVGQLSGPTATKRVTVTNDVERTNYSPSKPPETVRRSTSELPAPSAMRGSRNSIGGGSISSPKRTVKWYHVLSLFAVGIFVLAALVELTMSAP